MLLLKQMAVVVALSCGLILVSQGEVVAQPSVCVVDVAKVFENHAGFNSQLEDLKRQAEEYKFSLQQRGEQLRTESEQLKNYTVGSPEYKALETRLAQTSANLEVERRNKTREFVQAEARLHFDTYVQVTGLISGYCEQRGYRAALRFSNIPMDPNEPGSIMQRVNEYVVFHRPSIDITQDIIAALGNAGARTSSRPDEAPNR